MSFTPPWWLRNPHAQTVWGRLTRRRRLVRVRRETIETPDGDELVLDHLDAPATAAEPLHFVLMHGLEGSSSSVYIQGILAAVARAGHGATAINFRSCARHPRSIFRELPNRRPRIYHSGETSDFDFVAGLLAQRLPNVPLVAFGASMGGNVLLKWLGERPEQRTVIAAATISVPYDLGAGARYLDAHAVGRFYVRRFLSSLKRKTSAVVARFPETAKVVDLDRTLRARTFYEFDEAATGPLHGFTGADDYYTRSSSIHFIGRIAVPTLCISAEDDPFLPPGVLPQVAAAASPSVTMVVTPQGGHVGFVEGGVPWRCRYWAEEEVVRWLIETATRQRRAA